MTSVLKRISLFFLLIIFFDCFIYAVTVTEKEKNISIFKPEIQGISKEKEWIPDFIQNVIFDEIKQNYNVEVIFVEQNLDDQIIEETNSLFETENVEDFNPTEKRKSSQKNKSFNLHISGNYKTAFNLSFQLIENSTKQIFVSKKITGCSDLELESGKILKEIVFSLLSDLSIDPNGTGNSFSSYDPESFKATMDAQQLLAKGLYAQRQGLTVDAMNFFIRAKMKDSTLSKLSKALNTVSNSISAGDLGEKSRNLINARKSFIKLLDETEAYFEQNIPYVIVYSPKISLGKIDYENEKAKFLFRSAVVLKYDAKEIYENIVLLYKSQPDSANWNLSDRINNLLKQDGYLYVQYELYDQNGKKIAVTRNKVALKGKEVFLNEYSFNVPTKNDTSNLVFSISQTKFSQRNYKVSDKNWWASEKGNIDIEKNQIYEFQEKFIHPRCQLVESEVRAISYVTLPSSINFKEASSLLSFFGENLEILCDSYYPDIFEKEELVFTSSEKEKVNSYKKGNVLNNGWIVTGKMHVGDSSVPWHRKKNEFREHIKDYDFFDYRIQNNLNSKVFISFDNYDLLKSAEKEENEFFYKYTADVGYYREVSKWNSTLKKYQKSYEWVSTGSITRDAVTQTLADIMGYGLIKPLYKRTETDTAFYKYNEKENKTKYLNSEFDFVNYVESLLFKDVDTFNGDLYMTKPADKLAVEALKMVSLECYGIEIPDVRNEVTGNTYSYLNKLMRRIISNNESIFIVGKKEINKLRKSSEGKKLADQISQDSNYFYFYKTDKPPFQYNQRKRFDVKPTFPQLAFTAPDYLSLGLSFLEFDFPIFNHLYAGIDGGIQFISNTAEENQFYENCYFYGLGKLGLNFNINKGLMFSTYVDSGWYNGFTVGAGIELTTTKFRYNNFFVDYNLGYMFENEFTHSGRFYDRLTFGYVITLDLLLKK